MNKTRVITGIWMGAIFIPFVFFGGYFFYALMIVLSYIATMELVKMHNEKHNLSSSLSYIIPLLSVILNIVIMLSKMGIVTTGINYIIFTALVIGFFLLVLPLFYKSLKMTDGFFYLVCLFYGGVSFALMANIRNLGLFAEHNLMLGKLNINLAGLAIYVYTLFCSMFTDIFAYEVGRKFGKHKLIPDVSPKKTIEGSIGGTVIASILASICFILAEKFIGFNLFGINNIYLNILVIFIISIFLSLISQCGDLIASKLKREYEIKDYGKVFPGHGGVMDRFDSLILTTICFYIILALIGVVLW